MAQPCLICIDNAKAQRAAELIAAGVPDGRVAAQLGGVSRAAVQRHRTNHIIRPAQNRLAVISKGTPAREQRQQLAQAAQADAPGPQAIVDALLGMQAQAEKLGVIEARLERMAVLAEAGKSSNGVAQLSAQQLRSVEVGARLAGAGGYAPGRAAAADGTAAAFSVTITLGGDRKPLVISANAPVLDGTESHWTE